jgi:hypothetical protein
LYRELASLINRTIWWVSITSEESWRMRSTWGNIGTSSERDLLHFFLYTAVWILSQEFNFSCVTSYSIFSWNSSDFYYRHANNLTFSFTVY